MTAGCYSCGLSVVRVSCLLLICVVSYQCVLSVIRVFYLLFLCIVLYQRVQSVIWLYCHLFVCIFCFSYVLTFFSLFVFKLHPLAGCRSLKETRIYCSLLYFCLSTRIRLHPTHLCLVRPTGFTSSHLSALQFELKTAAVCCDYEPHALSLVQRRPRLHK